MCHDLRHQTIKLTRKPETPMVALVWLVKMQRYLDVFALLNSSCFSTSLIILLKLFSPPLLKKVYWSWQTVGRAFFFFLQKRLLRISSCIFVCGLLPVNDNNLTVNNCIVHFSFNSSFHEVTPFVQLQSRCGFDCQCDFHVNRGTFWGTSPVLALLCLCSRRLIDLETNTLCRRSGNSPCAFRSAINSFVSASV